MTGLERSSRSPIGCNGYYIRVFILDQHGNLDGSEWSDEELKLTLDELKLLHLSGFRPGVGSSIFSGGGQYTIKQVDFEIDKGVIFVDYTVQ
ncbi:MAG: hypothetical protein KDD62_00295 [Bdellovibrionales bacterium]|nr:hypothetical protein [Bdellovibrionales bacterium]